jgi:GntR family transcriptional regulator/MocR family aminotransferase
MPRVRSTVAIPSLGALDRTSSRVGLQLAQGLREAIASGVLRPGERLPSTRTLASSLGLARGTVVEAFDQLKAEGDVESLPRAGTAIARALAGQRTPVLDRAGGLASRTPDSGGTPPPHAPADGVQSMPGHVAWLSAIAHTL